MPRPFAGPAIAPEREPEAPRHPASATPIETAIETVIETVIDPRPTPGFSTARTARKAPESPESSDSPDGLDAREVEDRAESGASSAGPAGPPSRPAGALDSMAVTNPASPAADGSSAGVEGIGAKNDRRPQVWFRPHDPSMGDDRPAEPTLTGRGSRRPEPATMTGLEPGVGPASSEGGLRRDQARAADHLSAAGELESAAERYAHAAAEAASLGAYSQAMAHGRKALQLIESLPGSTGRRRFRAQLLVALGRMQWQAASTHGARPDPTFTLASALDSAEAATSCLDPDDPADLIAEVSTLIAGICYDLGDLRSLERALDELTRASRLLLHAGDSTGAARLLNDQAAVFVRLGDPVRASHLLSRSQIIFEERASNDPVTVQELAETHHLLARLPLHARIRPGREEDAYTMSLHHARQAEDSYRDLGRAREMGRVWETIGRVELARGKPDRAMERLAAALQLQSQIGDLTGLARSTAALSEVLVKDGKLREALDLLGDSILLNREKGSPIGLAFNRRALGRLDSAIEGLQSEDPEVAEALAEVTRRLDAAEEIIGRIDVPGLVEGEAHEAPA